MVQSALLGGVFNGVLSALPIISVGNCCCLWITGGGVVAAYLQQQKQQRSLTAVEGALLGLGAGAVGAVVWLGAYAAVDVVMAPIQDRMMAALLDRSVDMPPDVREWVTAVGSRTNSSLRYLIGFMVQIAAGGVFSTLGGVLGALFLRRDAPPALGGDPQ